MKPSVERESGLPDRRNGIAVASITGVHGVRGGLKVRLHNPGSGVLLEGAAIELVAPGRRVVSAKVRRFSLGPRSERARVWIDDVEDREHAERLKGYEIVVAREDLPPLAADEFYLADAIGCRVEQRRGDQTEDLGVVVAITDNGVQDLLEIRWDRGPKEHVWLLPVVPGIVLGLEGDRVLVDVPDGMGPRDQTPGVGRRR